MNNKWILWIGIVVVLILFVLVWQFAPAINDWLAHASFRIIMLVLTFAVGWLVGRYGGKGPNGERKERNARNITEAQDR